TRSMTWPPVAAVRSARAQANGRNLAEGQVARAEEGRRARFARAPVEKDVLTPGGPRRPHFQCAGAPCRRYRLSGRCFLPSRGLVRGGTKVQFAFTGVPRSSHNARVSENPSSGRGGLAVSVESEKHNERPSVRAHRLTRSATRQDCTFDPTRRLRRSSCQGRLADSPRQGRSGARHPSGGHTTPIRGEALIRGSQGWCRCGTRPNLLRSDHYFHPT